MLSSTLNLEKFSLLNDGNSFSMFAAFKRNIVSNVTFAPRFRKVFENGYYCFL